MGRHKNTHETELSKPRENISGNHVGFVPMSDMRPNFFFRELQRKSPDGPRFLRMIGGDGSYIVVPGKAGRCGPEGGTKCSTRSTGRRREQTSVATGRETRNRRISPAEDAIGNSSL